MEHNEVSLHQVKVFRFVQHQQGWVTAKEVAAGAGVRPRTAREHLHNLVELGIFEQAEVFPAHRYHYAAKAAQRNGGYLQRLEATCAVFGL